MMGWVLVVKVAWVAEMALQDCLVTQGLADSCCDWHCLTLLHDTARCQGSCYNDCSTPKAVALVGLNWLTDAAMMMVHLMVHVTLWLTVMRAHPSCCCWPPHWHTPRQASRRCSPRWHHGRCRACAALTENGCAPCLLAARKSAAYTAFWSHTCRQCSGWQS
jgi:hypothetical protein